MSVSVTFQQLDQRLAHLEREIRTLRQSLTDQATDESTHTLVKRRPEVCGGEPVLVGTRTPVRAIVEHVRLGDRVNNILEHLPYLTVEHIHAALDYYRSHKQEIDDSIELNNDGGTTRPDLLVVRVCRTGLKVCTDHLDAPVRSTIKPPAASDNP
jgi:uncharacterized protein (DUF433 family)